MDAQPTKVLPSTSLDLPEQSDGRAAFACWLRDFTKCLDVSRFQRIWQVPVTAQGEQGFLAACWEKVAERALSEGEYFLAFDSAEHGLTCAKVANFPPHELVRQKVTALARSGALKAAKRELAAFLEGHAADAALCSTMARLLRDSANAERDPAARRELFHEAIGWAQKAQAQAAEGGWAYPANQEAQFLFMAGDWHEAKAKAASVISRHTGRDMWSETGLAEMHLLQGDFKRARDHYRASLAAGGDAPGHLAANRAVAASLCRRLREYGVAEATEARMNEWFPQPTILVFAGHVPDAAGRESARLPERLCRAGGPVARALQEKIAALEPIEGICASAPGGDILFGEALLAHGGRSRLLLMDPFPRERIVHVAKRMGEDWAERLERIFTGALRTEPIACAEDANEAAQCEYANRVMIGSAMLRARTTNAKLRAVALWDEADAAAPTRGGTGEFAAICRKANIELHIVNPRQNSE